PELGSDPAVLEVSIGPEGQAAGDDEAAGALTRRDPERSIVIVAGAGPLAENVRIAGRGAERDERHVAAADLARALGDALQHGREVERGVDASDHVRQELGLALAPARFFVEARVLDRDGRLVGQEPREVLFLGGEAGPTAEPDDQRADRAIVM